MENFEFWEKGFPPIVQLYIIFSFSHHLLITFLYLSYLPKDSVVGLIDPTYFQDPETGKHYALWKGDTWVTLD